MQNHHHIGVLKTQAEKKNQLINEKNKKGMMKNQKINK